MIAVIRNLCMFLILAPLSAIAKPTLVWQYANEPHPSRRLVAIMNLKPVPGLCSMDVGIAAIEKAEIRRNRAGYGIWIEANVRGLTKEIMVNEWISQRALGFSPKPLRQLFRTGSKVLLVFQRCGATGSEFDAISFVDIAYASQQDLRPESN